MIRGPRLIPHIFSCINYLSISIFLILRFGIDDALTLSMIAVTLSPLFISLITPYWKISTHSSGAAGILTAASTLFYKYPNPEFFFPYVTLISLNIAVFMARLQLKVHTASQLIAGCILGGLFGLLCFSFL